MSDILIRTEGRAGRITLNRPQSLNALTHAMVRAIATALEGWREDPAVALVLIDATGPRAFCAGGDIQQLYDTGRAGDFAYGQAFWAEEYRLNALIAAYPKPFVALMQGFTMGGGVGVSCLGSTRIVGETSRIAMPECGIGLVPDVGGSWLLARAPGRLGEYLGLTGARMGPGDAILCGFADRFVPEARWEALAARIVATGEPEPEGFAEPPPPGELAALRDGIDRVFARDGLPAIRAALPESEPWAEAARAALDRACPLSLAVALDLIRAARAEPGVTAALRREYRFSARCMARGEFLEGVRAAVIDKDRTPRWQIDPTPERVAAMLAPLGAAEWSA